VVFKFISFLEREIMFSVKESTKLWGFKHKMQIIFQLFQERFEENLDALLLFCVAKTEETIFQQN
jgi:hypothetical protein